MNEAMALLCRAPPTITTHAIPRVHIRNSAASKLPRQPLRFSSPHIQIKHLPLRCTKLSPWQPSPLPYASDDESESIVKGSSIFESVIPQETAETSADENFDGITDVKSQSSVEPQLLKWPMWLLGPSVLLATGMVPTLWLPLSSVFLGPNIAGLLSLVGLDCIFNIGATLFLLMADACARPKSTNQVDYCRVPRTYRFWNMGAGLIGFLMPLIMLSASYRGFLQPQLPFISFLALLGPYLLLLSIQMLTEMLTWHWKSPVWLLTPIVYEAYRVLQLMRGLNLGGDIGVPTWALHSIRGLVSWWVLILGVQLMRVSWFAGFTTQSQQQQP